MQVAGCYREGWPVWALCAHTLNQWKKKFLQNASLAFDMGGATREYREKIEKLQEENEALAKTLGKTTVERDWAVGKLKSLDLSSKKSLVTSKLNNLSLTRQCELLGLNRSSFYYRPVPMGEYDLSIMRRIDEIYTDVSTYGYRKIHAQLRNEGWHVGHNKVHRLMQMMGIEAVYPRKKKVTSIKTKEHKIYPYVLTQFYNDEKQVIVEHPNQVWSGDITYIPVKGGFLYLSAIIDWHSRALLAWRLSNTMDASLVTGVLQEAIDKHGEPEIFNSDQGSQYTGKEHTELLGKHGITISMNGKGRSIDNIIIERFFRTLKYEEIYLKEYEDVKELKAGIRRFITFYNYNRLHASLAYDKPMNVYQVGMKQAA